VNDLGLGPSQLGLKLYLVKTGKYRTGDEHRGIGVLQGVEESFATMIDRLLEKE